ncbi:MAG: T9SS type A sorting domain-containing protein [Lewinellaceae bacterium]|nr:zinc-dependent metalloprotease [Phaeodactylibacter sp.]MCB9040611.1 T9SS type A sorting domain-containing protein [Lewinellaceae bacterium]
MKKIITFLAFALGLAISAHAQDTQAGTCGTPPFKSEWLERYQQNPRVINRTMLQTIYVPVTFHMVGRDDGTGYISYNRLMDAFCQLNEIFEQAEIQFYVKGNIRYINNDDYYDHDYPAGGQMMQNYNVPNTVNFYICNGLPNNALGYYSPSGDAVAVEKGALSGGDFTWAHEAGHYLSLPHTFYGWETTDYSYDSPTPNTVTWANTIRQVERVNGSNCSFAGDGFCDTSPDYLNFRWGCNGDGMSPQIQKDPNGVEFRSDGSLIMGYALDNCVTRFTDGQIGAMRANLEEERPGHLVNQTPPVPVASNELTPIFPAEGEDVQNGEAFDLQWEPIEGAQFYVVEISRIPTFAFTVANYITTNSSVSVGADELAADKTFYWRIRPFNRYDACVSSSDVHTFQTADLVSSTSSQETVQGLRIYPNPAKDNQEVALEFASEQASNATVSLLNLTGQALQSRRLEVVPGANRTVISTAGLPKGLYLVRIDANGGANYRKLLVQ